MSDGAILDILGSQWRKKISDVPLPVSCSGAKAGAAEVSCYRVDSSFSGSAWISYRYSSLIRLSHEIPWTSLEAP